MAVKYRSENVVLTYLFSLMLDVFADIHGVHARQQPHYQNGESLNVSAINSFYVTQW